MAKQDTINTAIRIPKDVYEKIEFEAESNNSNISSVINAALRKHVTWDQFVSDIGFVFMQKPFLRTIFEKISEGDLVMAARTTCHSGMRDAVVFIHGKIAVDAIVDVIKLWLSASDMPLRVVKKTDMLEFRIQHNLGKKGSLYFSTLLITLFEEIEIVPAKNPLLKDHAAIVTFKIKKTKPKKK
ncbi:hypothetical protein [Nitrosopumilus sp.]|uniref:hypothetical protein n=1 Tax=Nitrosopumilus sp. TaxID=2024843 RepID=UPI0029310B3C|nr:hypothetical protein [Nitrosopumilus sp.]